MCVYKIGLKATHFIEDMSSGQHLKTSLPLGPLAKVDGAKKSEQHLAPPKRV